MQEVDFSRLDTNSMIKHDKVIAKSRNVQNNSTKKFEDLYARFTALCNEIRELRQYYIKQMKHKYNLLQRIIIKIEDNENNYYDEFEDMAAVEDIIYEIEDLLEKMYYKYKKDYRILAYKLTDIEDFMDMDLDF